MNWEQVITELQAVGLSEEAIGKAVGASQASINRIKKGEQTPNWNVGDSLISLHRSECGKAA